MAMPPVRIDSSRLLFVELILRLFRYLLLLQSICFSCSRFASPAVDGAPGQSEPLSFDFRRGAEPTVVRSLAGSFVSLLLARSPFDRGASSFASTTQRQLGSVSSLVPSATRSRWYQSPLLPAERLLRQVKQTVLFPLTPSSACRRHLEQTSHASVSFSSIRITSRRLMPAGQL